MLNQATIDKLNNMKLYGMVQALQDHMENPRYNELSFEERFAMIVDKEMVTKENRRLATLLRKARLRNSQACIEDIDFKANRGLLKDQIISLSNGDWIKHKQNIIITGPAGVGKTYIACALANSACRGGMSSYYIRLPLLLKELDVSANDGSYGKILSKFSRIRLLIVDDWGFDQLTNRQRISYLDIIEDRHNISSTIICSQVPIEKWHDNIGDPTVADAICDRLIHNAHKIKLKGGSMRIKYSGL